MYAPSRHDGVNRPISELPRHKAARTEACHVAQKLARFAPALRFDPPLRALAFPRGIAAIVHCAAAFTKEAVPVLRVRGAHMRKIDDMPRLAQRPGRIATGVLLRPRTKLSSILRFALLLVLLVRTEALLKRCLLTTVNKIYDSATTEFLTQQFNVGD
ncbi:MAG: hypothetical protein ACREMP_00550 [Candidatus Tyrphobacter sp.]